MSSPVVKPVANILVVDDMPDNLRLLSRMLTDHGYQVRPVLNGAQALVAAQTQPPDLILLDIMMPMMNGFEVCEQLKADVRTCDIPVLFISALSDMDNKITAFTAGGVDYVTKPFQLEEVLARVRTHLTLHSLQQQLRQELLARNGLIADLHAYAHTVAHDLRNPLSVAVGYAQLLEMQGDAMAADERQQYLAAMTQGLRKLASIVDELLLLAEVRREELDVTPLAMDAVVSEALRRVADLAERAGGVTVDAPAQWPMVLGYAPWLEEVWVNYLSNALKYGGTPPRVEIGAEILGAQVRCWVRDHGDGLTAEQQALLFTPFERLDQARATGHGLGLSIVRRIITKLDGEVGVESPGLPGQGCIFWFTLPAA